MKSQISVQRNCAIYHALLSSFYTSGESFLDPFATMVNIHIDTNCIRNFNIQKICKSFSAEQGIEIPDAPMRSIVNILISKNIVKKKHNKAEYQVVKLNNTDNLRNQQREYESRYDEITKKHHKFLMENGLSITIEDAEEYLISFLKKQSENIVNNEDGISRQQAKLDNRLIFLTAKYIEKSLESRVEAGFLLEMTVGYLISECVCFETDNNILLSSVEIFLDTPLLFHLFGMNRNDDKNIYVEMVKSIREQGGSVCVFSHTVNEMEDVLKSAAYWIERCDLDPSKASQTLDFFLESGARKIDVEDEILNIPKYIREYNIEIIDTSRTTSDDVDKLGYRHAEEDIAKTIINTYRENHYISASEEKRQKATIDIDSKSITEVYIRRKGICSQSLNGCHSIIVTTNAQLAVASFKYDAEFHKREEIQACDIPTCVSDVFLGTAIWLNNPINVSELSQKQLTAQLLVAFQPNAALHRKFVEEVNRAESSGNLTPEKCYMLRCSPVVSKMLMEITQGDPAAVSNQTPYEIIKQIEARARSEAEEKARTEFELVKEVLCLQQEEAEKKKNLVMEEIERVNQEILKKDTKIQDIIHTAKKRVETITKTINRILIVAMIVLIIVIIAITVVANMKLEGNMRLGCNILLALLGLSILGSFFTAVLSLIRNKEIKFSALTLRNFLVSCARKRVCQNMGLRDEDIEI